MIRSFDLLFCFLFVWWFTLVDFQILTNPDSWDTGNLVMVYYPFLCF